VGAKRRKREHAYRREQPKAGKRHKGVPAVGREERARRTARANHDSKILNPARAPARFLNAGSAARALATARKRRARARISQREKKTRKQKRKRRGARTRAGVGEEPPYYTTQPLQSNERALAARSLV